MPTPREGESKNDFISRCASEMADEKPNIPNDQRLAICYSYWERQNEGKSNTKAFNELKEFYASDLTAEEFLSPGEEKSHGIEGE